MKAVIINFNLELYWIKLYLGHAVTWAVALPQPLPPPVNACRRWKSWP